jgi:ornithine cyclodeaminase/alanine dehydrogenase-like protein (mu-crystallin family)
MREAIRLVREAFRELASGEALNQPRRRMVLPTGAVLHSMAGGCGRYFGTKIYTTHPVHGAHFLFVLYEAATGAPLAIFEANYLGQIRTGAATGVATDLLSHKEADTLGIIGCGFQARSQVEAVLRVRPLRNVRAWSRSEARRRTFVGECSREFGVEVQAVNSARDAVEGAQIVVTATSSKEPVLESGWIAAGAHINAVGSNQARRRELPEALIRRASLVAVDSIEQARIESGDLLLALDDDEWATLPVAELKDIVAGKADRKRAEDVTIFKSNGLGLEDVVAAGFVYEQLKGHS